MIKHILSFVLFFIGVLSYGQFGFERLSSVDVTRTGDLQKLAWAGGMDYCQFSSIDLDFDGVEDLFVFDRTCNKVLTFIQTGEEGESNYVYAPEYEEDFPEGLNDWVLLVDYDCDGKKDIYSNVLGGASVYRNVGNAEIGNEFELVKPILRTFAYGDYAYMFVGSQDIPAITDIDGDGDKDILTFGVPGITVEYHRNMSMEMFGTCDSLEYETKNICWGRFKENGASNEVTLWDTLTSPCTSMDLTAESPLHALDGQDRHAGSTVLALDMNNSGVMDLVLGDASYPNMVLLLNSGTEPNTNSGMDFQDTEFPSTSVPVDLPIFPGAFHVDINNDGIRDLVVSPNSKIGSQNVKSVWRYINEGEDLEPDFVFQEEDFIQGEMIDVGTSSFPVFFDHNGDGLKDLLVSSQGQYNEATGNQISKIAYYENVGTAESAEFEWVTGDYEEISEMGIGNSLVFYPTFGDLDGDGDEDMILGEYTGYCYYMENTGGAGNPAIFNTFITLTTGDGTPIFEGTYTYPQLVDLDRDGDQDLVIGRRTGKLQFFENTGVGTYNFTEVTEELGSVDVSGVGFLEGHAIPQFVDVDGDYQLIVGSKRGFVYYYDDIDGNLDGDFHLVDSTLDNIAIGTYSAPAVTNLNDNNRLEMVLGNRRGGVVLYQSAPTDNIGLLEYGTEQNVLIYPNPSNDLVNVQLGTLSAKQLKQIDIRIYSLTGELIHQHIPTNNTVQIDVSNFARGTYIIEINDTNTTIKEKLILN